MRAADLIAERTNRGPEIPAEKLAEVIKELRTLCKHNDTCVNVNARVGRDAVIKMLATYGVRVGNAGLDQIARNHLGRKSWARP